MRCLPRKGNQAGASWDRGLSHEGCNKRVQTVANVVTERPASDQAESDNARQKETSNTARANNGAPRDGDCD